ncbi:MAG: cytochrome c [Pirellulales bacterium]|nr:cytochrome c [Pirellulales bacterium]
MGRVVARTGFLVVAVLLCAVVWAQSHRKPPNKRPPQRWDQRILNAFFEDIRSAVGPGEPGTAPRTAPGGGSVATTDSGVGDGGATGGFAWSELVSAETLEDEIKKIALDLEETVASPGRFKSGRHNDARRMFSVSAVVFAVINEYDKDVRFKDNSAGLRNAVAKAGVNCKVNTDGAYNDAKAKFQQLQEIVRGANVEIPAPKDPLPHVEVAEYGPLMQRMELGFLEIVKPGTSSGAEFRSAQEDILHEAEILALFSQFFHHESYDYGEDETFLGLADELQSQAKALATATKTGDLNAAQSAVGAIDKSCTECHGGYRGWP